MLQTAANLVLYDVVTFDAYIPETYMSRFTLMPISEKPGRETTIADVRLFFSLMVFLFPGCKGFIFYLSPSSMALVLNGPELFDYSFDTVISFYSSVPPCPAPRYQPSNHLRLQWLSGTTPSPCRSLGTHHGHFRTSGQFQP